VAEEEEERETKDIKEREKRQDTKMVQAKRDLQEKAILLREEMVKLLQRPRGEAFVRRSKTVRFIYSTIIWRFGEYLEIWRCGLFIRSIGVIRVCW